MPLPFVVEDLETVPEPSRELYKEVDGKFTLDVEGLPEVKPQLPDDYDSLRKSVEKLEANNQSLLKEKSDAKKAAEQAKLEAAKKSGDVDAVEASWGEKYQKLQEDAKGRASQLTGTIEQLTVKADAARMASELALSGHAEIYEPHILRRLAVDIPDDGSLPRTIVLDKDGKRSALTKEELMEEFRANPAFAPFTKGSKASGGGPANRNSAGGVGVPSMSIEQFNALSPAEKHKFAIAKGEIV